MNEIFPLKKAYDEDISHVGQKAKLLSAIEQKVTLPFSMVISGDIWNVFLKTNNLESEVKEIAEKPYLSKEERISAFIRFAERFQKATFPKGVLDELRECFELVSIDQDDLSIDAKRKSRRILTLQRSTSYEDGDTICHGKIFTADKFDEFVRLIKSIYLSTLAPSSIKFRQERNIKGFSTAIIVSAFPQVKTCFESMLQENNNTISVNSYVGFPDNAAIVNRDKFLLSLEFLRIVTSKIASQQTVSVFDVQSNRMLLRDFDKGSAQSATEQQVLEAGRLTKKIASILECEKCYCEFVLDKMNKMYCTNVFFERIDGQNNSDETRDILRSDTPSSTDNELTNDKNKEFIPLIKDVEGMQLQPFIEQLIYFLEEYRNSEFSASINVIVRSLKQDCSTETILQALTIAKDIVKAYELNL